MCIAHNHEYLHWTRQPFLFGSFFFLFFSKTLKTQRTQLDQQERGLGPKTNPYRKRNYGGLCNNAYDKPVFLPSVCTSEYRHDRFFLI